MRIFANCKEMMSEMKRDIHEMGTLVHPQTMQDLSVEHDPGYATLELSPASFMILDGSDRDQMIEDAKASLAWCQSDFDERVFKDRENPGTAWKHRRETWERFIHNGKFAYTYSERLWRRLQDRSIPFIEGNLAPTRPAIHAIIQELVKHPETRQAVLPIFNGDLDLCNLGGKARVPCSLHYQFLRRRGQLDIIYVMRSSDFNTHFVYDIWQALELLGYVAERISAPVGRMTFFSGSLHIYRKDADEGTF